MRKTVWQVATLIAAFAMILSACATPTPAPTAVPATSAPAATQPPATEAPTAVPPTQAPFVFGMLLVGAHNDQGWSQATYDGGQYIEQNVPNTKMLYLENVYSGSPSYPGQTASQLAEQLVSQGAKMVIFNSDDMKDEALKFANAHPDVYVIGVSDDWTWKDGQNYQASANQVDIMGRMEYMKMIGGCAAALTTKSGKIGYLGPLINDETRRLSSSAFLGAKYCWTNILKNDPAKLSFKVTWIGFWFNIPGVTSDPTQVADDFFNSGYDVVISGIDTTEALVEAKKMHDAGKYTYAIAYDYKTNCSVAPDICLGVPYFNWGPAFAAAAKTAIDGSWKENFQWNGPDWTNINNPDTSAVGFNKGNGLSADASTKLDGFISELAGGLTLWKGPLNLQDKTPYLKDGETATDLQIWYLPQLLEGMDGQSVPSK
ncbi:MAG TPA: BMP family ABC transporter substrate-binding protein [Anaerolineales bacterium]|nr:BMP family ABC transporter substrate-binding protein [Anaerolineales bacterium]